MGTRTLTRKDNAVASGYQIDHALSHKRTVDNIHIEERAKRDDIAKWCDTGEEDECTDREYCNVIGKYCADCADICGVEDNSYRQMCQNKCPTEYAKQQATSTVTAGLKQTRETTNSVTPETSAPHYNESMIQTSVLVCLIVAIVLFLIVLLVGLILGIRLCISRSNPCGRRSSNEVMQLIYSTFPLVSIRIVS